MGARDEGDRGEKEGRDRFSLTGEDKNIVRVMKGAY